MLACFFGSPNWHCELALCHPLPFRIPYANEHLTMAKRKNSSYKNRHIASLPSTPVKLTKQLILTAPSIKKAPFEVDSQQCIVGKCFSNTSAFLTTSFAEISFETSKRLLGRILVEQTKYI